MLYLPTSSYFDYSTSLIFMQDRRYNKYAATSYTCSRKEG